MAGGIQDQWAATRARLAEVRRTISHGAQDTWHVSANFMGAPPNLANTDEHYEAWGKPRVSYSGSHPERAGTTIWNSGMSCGNAAAFGLACIPISVLTGIYSYLRNTAMTARTDLSACSEYAFNTRCTDATDHRYFLTRYFTPMVLGTLYAAPLFAAGYISAEAMLAIVYAPLVVPLLSAAVIGVAAGSLVHIFRGAFEQSKILANHIFDTTHSLSDHPPTHKIQLAAYGVGQAISFLVLGPIFLNLSELSETWSATLNCALKDDTAPRRAIPESYYEIAARLTIGSPGIVAGAVGGLITSAAFYCGYSLCSIGRAFSKQVGAYHHWQTHRPQAVTVINPARATGANDPAAILAAQQAAGRRQAMIPGPKTDQAYKAGDDHQSGARQAAPAAKVRTGAEEPWLSHIIASPFAGLSILGMAQWYGFKHTVQDVYYRWGECSDREDIGHIAQQPYWGLRTLGLLGYAAGISASAVTTLFIWAHEVRVTTINLSEYLLPFVRNGIPKNYKHTVVTERPCIIHAASWIGAAPLSLLGAFFVNLATCFNWTYDKIESVSSGRQRQDENLKHPPFQCKEIARYCFGSPAYLVGAIIGCATFIPSVGTETWAIAKVKIEYWHEWALRKEHTPAPDAGTATPARPAQEVIEKPKSVKCIAQYLSIALYVPANFVISVSAGVRDMVFAGHHASWFNDAAKPIHHVAGDTFVRLASNLLIGHLIGAALAWANHNRIAFIQGINYLVHAAIPQTDADDSERFMINYWNGGQTERSVEHINPHSAAWKAQGFWKGALRLVLGSPGYIAGATIGLLPCTAFFMYESYCATCSWTQYWHQHLMCKETADDSPDIPVFNDLTSSSILKFPAHLVGIGAGGVLGLLEANALAAIHLPVAAFNMMLGRETPNQWYKHPPVTPLDVARILASPGYALGIAFAAVAGSAGLAVEGLVQSVRLTRSAYCWMRASEEESIHHVSETRSTRRSTASVDTHVTTLSELEAGKYGAPARQASTVDHTPVSCREWVVRILFSPVIAVGAIGACTLGSAVNMNQTISNQLFDTRYSGHKQVSAGRLFFGSLGYVLSVPFFVVPMTVGFGAIWLVEKAYQSRDCIKDGIAFTTLVAISTPLMLTWKLFLKPIKSTFFGRSWAHVSGLLSLSSAAIGVYYGAQSNNLGTGLAYSFAGGVAGMTLRAMFKHVIGFKSRFAYINPRDRDTASSYNRAFQQLFAAFSMTDHLPAKVNNTAEEYKQSLWTRILRDWIQIPTTLVHQSLAKRCAKGLHTAWLDWEDKSKLAGHRGTFLNAFTQSPKFRQNMQKIRATFGRLKQEAAEEAEYNHTAPPNSQKARAKNALEQAVETINHTTTVFGTILGMTRLDSTRIAERMRGQAVPAQS